MRSSYSKETVRALVVANLFESNGAPSANINPDKALCKILELLHNKKCRNLYKPRLEKIEFVEPSSNKLDTSGLSVPDP